MKLVPFPISNNRAMSLIIGGPAKPADWDEDFDHENGDYNCRCVECGCAFRGHKRRVICKLCFNKPTQEEGKEND